MKSLRSANRRRTRNSAKVQVGYREPNGVNHRRSREARRQGGPEMLKAVKKSVLRSCEMLGLSTSVARSAWRRNHLLILAYHGIAQDDEHLWSPGLYMSPTFFRARLQAIKEAGCQVLPMSAVLEQLYAGELPPRSIALTFDDGPSDFCTQAYPILRDFGYPTTVYLTPYYCDYYRPVFPVACSYLLWKRRSTRLDLRAVTGTDLIFE